MSNYFLDTSFIIAYMISSDKQHQKAEDLEEIMKAFDFFVPENVKKQVN